MLLIPCFFDPWIIFVCIFSGIWIRQVFHRLLASARLLDRNFDIQKSNNIFLTRQSSCFKLFPLPNFQPNVFFFWKNFRSFNFFIGRVGKSRQQKCCKRLRVMKFWFHKLYSIFLKFDRIKYVFNLKWPFVLLKTLWVKRLPFECSFVAGTD